MSNLNENSSFEEMENFMLFHMDNADDRKSKINPSLTKKQVWDINMGCVINKRVRVQGIAIKHIVREFGSYYE
jgi:hypothetical protein